MVAKCVPFKKNEFEGHHGGLEPLSPIELGGGWVGCLYDEKKSLLSD